MKRLWLLFVMLFLAACGGGGGSTGSGAQPTSGSGTGTGAVSLKFVDGTKQATAKMVAGSIVTPEPGRVRVLFTSATYKTVVDLPFGSPDSTVALPVGVYTAEALYYENGTLRTLTNYGKAESTITVNAGSNTASLITMSPINIALTLPAEIYSGGLYSATAPTNDLPNVGLAKEWSLAVKMTADPETANPFTGPVHLAQSPSELHTNIVAPLVQNAGKLYFQGEFFIRADFLKQGESATDWRYAVESSAIPLKINTVGGVVPTQADNIAPQITYFSVPASKQGTTNISPIYISATDNAGIAFYNITKTTSIPSDGWVSTAPTSYPYGDLALENGKDTKITLYAWVKDFSGHISEPVQKDVIINNTPVVTKFITPSTILFNKNVPVTFNAKNFTGAVGALQYAITENPLQPTGFTPFPTADAKTGDFNVTYLVQSITQQAGVKYNVPLFVWVKDGQGTVSQSLRNNVTICDLPQVTSFKIWSPVPNGNEVTILSLEGKSADDTPVKLLVTTTNTVPESTDFPDSAQTKVVYPGVTAGQTKQLYAWAMDSRGLISAPKAVSVYFPAP